MRRLLSVLLFVLLAQGAAAQSLLDVSQKPWAPFPERLRGQFLAATGIERGLALHREYLTIQEQPLSWSQGSHLIRVLGGWEPRSLVLYFILRADGALIHLDGSFAAIEALNASVPPNITPETVGDYVWFTGFFVRTRTDPFLVVETPQDRFLPPLKDGTGTLAEGYARPEDIPRKLSCQPDAATRGFTCEGTVYHATSIYDANFRILPNGLVEMPSSHRLAANLGAMVNAPIDPRGDPQFVPLP